MYFFKWQFLFPCFAPIKQYNTYMPPPSIQNYCGVRVYLFFMVHCKLYIEVRFEAVTNILVYTRNM